MPPILLMQSSSSWAPLLACSRRSSLEFSLAFHHFCMLDFLAPQNSIASKRRTMRKPQVLLSVCLLVSATAVFGQNVPDLNPGATENPHIHKFPVKGWAAGGGGGQNLVYHRNGAVIQVAHVVMIFWG